MNRAVNVGLVVLVLFVGVVAASSIGVTGDLPLQTTTGFTVTLENPGSFPASNPFPASGDTISLSSGTVTAAAAGELTIPNGGSLTGTTTELESIDLLSTTAQIDPSDKSQFDISGDVTAIGVQTTIAVDDGNADFDYTSTGSYDLVLRGLPASTGIVALDSSGQTLGTGTSDGSGTLTLTMTETGTNTAELITNDAPALSNLAPDGTTETDPDVLLSVDVDDTSFAKLGGDSIEVEFYDASDNSQIGTTQTVTSAATVTQTFTQTTNGQVEWYVEATDQYGLTTRSADQSFTMDEPEPVLSDESPADGANVNQPPLTLSIDVEDVGLGDYDTVTVTFKDNSDNSTIGSETLTSNGTATVTWSDPDTGLNEWYVEADDTFGNSLESNVFQVTIPELLTLRDVNDPDTILTSPTIDATVRFFESETGDTAVFPRTPQNGQIDMAGLPSDQEFVVGVIDSSDTYAQRLTLLDSIFQQQEIYLLNNSADTAVATLILQDRTGEFETGATSVQIERSVNTTDSPQGEEEYVTVAGDVIGTQLTFSTTLEQDIRYRVAVENDKGDRRTLGSFVLQGDRVINLIISGKEVGVPIPEDTPVIDVSQDIDDNTGDKTVSLTYIDPQAETDSLVVRVENADDPSDVVDTVTATAGPYGTFTYTETFSEPDASKVLVANATATRNGQQVTLTKPFGTGMFPIAIPLSQDWKQIFGIGFLMVVAGIFSVGNARIGAVVLPGVAGLLYVTGILNGAISLLAIGMALTVGVLVNLAFGGRGLLQ
jgi:hypothetical protein